MEEEQETDKSVAVIYRIRRVLRPFNEWLNICESLLENEENGFLNDILKIRYVPVNGERLDYYVDLLFRLCDSMENGSFIGMLVDVVGSIESSAKERNITVLLTTHSPNFLLAVDALMRKYDIREKCNFYQTELNDDNSIKYVEKTDCLDNIYSDFAESFAEMNALRKKHMILEE